MKRFLAIATLVLMLVNYTGFELCIDYCCDQIESIHLGAAHDPCHEDLCHPGSKGDCCDTDEVRLDQQLLEFTKVTVSVMEPVPVPAELPRVTDFKFNLGGALNVLRDVNISLPPLSVTEQTQCFRC